MEKSRDPLARIISYAAYELKHAPLDQHQDGEETSGYDMLTRVLGIIGTREALDALYQALIEDESCVCHCLLNAWGETGDIGKEYLIQKLNFSNTEENDKKQLLYVLHACWQEDERVIEVIKPYQESGNPQIRGAACGDHDPL